MERLVLVLVMVASTLSLVSYRYHLFARNYDTFLIKQVIPSLGVDGWLAKSFGYNPAAYNQEMRATLGSPYFPEFESEDRTRTNATSSDYLGIWFYTREVVNGRNPYAISVWTHFVSHEHYENFPGKRNVVYDPTVPDQLVGTLSYPPMGVMLILPFYSSNYFASFGIYLLVLHLFLFWLAVGLIARSPGYRLPVAFLLLTMYLTSYPLGMLIDRGNIEGSVFMLVALGLLAYGRGYHLVSAVLLGLAASGKVVPAVFFGLFLLDGRFLSMAVAVLTMGGANLIAMLCMNAPLGTILSQLQANMAEAKAEGTSGFTPDRFNHSLFGAARGGAFLTLRAGRAWYVLTILARIYTPMILGATALILVILRRLPFTNRVLVLSTMMLAFPYVSNDYKLIHLYVPFGLVLLGVVRKGWASSAEVAVLVILTLIFSPKSYKIGFNSADFLINGLLLASLIVIGLWARLGEAEAEADAGEARPSVALP